MQNKLQQIIEQKQREVQQLKNTVANDPQHSILQLLNGKKIRPEIKSFKQALRKSQLAVIAEIKRKSPSKGVLAEISDPVQLAQKYVSGGADAISVLTDQQFFSGSINDLMQTALALKETPIPILRKDFIIDPLQIAESIVAGADAILLIVAVLGNKTADLLDSARQLGIDVLVEVHNEQELTIALQSKADIIGINNRDLTTFNIDTERAVKLATQIPSQIIKVAESGIIEPHIAQRYFNVGFNAVLIGEALVKNSDPAEFITECKKHVTSVN